MYWDTKRYLNNIRILCKETTKYMLLDTLLRHYDEEVLHHHCHDRPFHVTHTLDDNLVSCSVVTDELLELYGTKVKKCCIVISEDMMTEDFTELRHILIPVDFLSMVASRIELSIGGEIVYWLENGILKNVLGYYENHGIEMFDLLQPYIDYIPLRNVNGSQIDIILNVLPEFLDSDLCLKTEQEHRLFRYAHYDEGYEKDFGYDEKAFDFYKTTNHFVKIPSITIYGSRFKTHEPCISIPVTQIYTLSNHQQGRKIVLKNSHLIGIATELLFELTIDSKDISGVHIDVIADQGIVDDLQLIKHEDFEHIYYLRLPERKCNLRDARLVFLVSSVGMVRNIYAVFTNSLQIYDCIGNLAFVVHQKNKFM